MPTDLALKELILRQLPVPRTPEDIRDDTDLLNDLAMDSLALANLLADLEEEFGVDIPASEETLSLLTRYDKFQSYVAARARTAPPEDDA
ncbi:phosphopantetheine-binding protein [Cohnella zeiphila]|uniref:Acyl carrier protein n=1 Tax=Cohnella zeiphila TaxID=2761120 RepID=A0A7X0VTK7_9BACL|nr:phosphopantetheine-binding protein [Cohnella zeiphila]MBB6729984.1 acyl carrier protein [Cohnella zeiphila]